MTTASATTVQLDDDLVHRLYGAISEFIYEMQRPSNTESHADNVKSNLQIADASLTHSDDRAEDHALRAALSGLGFIESDIHVRLFLSKLRFTFRRDMDVMHTEHAPFRLMCSLVSHVADLLRQIDRFNDPTYGDGTFRLDADWGNPRIEMELYRLRRRLRQILMPRNADD